MGQLEERYQEIVVKRDIPRRLEIHGCLKRDKEEKVTYSYPDGDGIDDLLQSYVERFADFPGVEDTVLRMW